MPQIPIEDIVDHNDDVMAFADSLTGQYDSYLDDLIRAIKMIMIDAPETTQNIRRINQIIAEYRRAALAIYDEFNEKVLIKQLQDFGLEESRWEVSAIRSAVKSNIKVTQPFRAQIWAAVTSEMIVFPDAKGAKLLGPFIKDWEAGQIKRMGDIIRTGYLTGKSSEQIVRELTGPKGFLRKNSKNAIKAMVITSTNHVSNVSRLKSFTDNDDLIGGYEIISVNDSRRTEICTRLNHKKVKWSDKYKPRPPFHPRCRTTTVALIRKEFAA